MKLYNRKYVLLALIYGLPVIYEWKHFSGARSVVWMGFFLYMGLRCLSAAFSEKRADPERDDENSRL